MSDAAEFLKHQAEAVSLAREQYAEDFSGCLGHRIEAVKAVIWLAETNSDQLTFDQMLAQAKRLAPWLAGHEE